MNDGVWLLKWSNQYLNPIWVFGSRPTKLRAQTLLGLTHGMGGSDLVTVGSSALRSRDSSQKRLEDQTAVLVLVLLFFWVTYSKNQFGPV
jgi:hypothetical protein